MQKFDKFLCGNNSMLSDHSIKSINVTIESPTLIRMENESATIDLPTGKKQS